MAEIITSHLTSRFLDEFAAEHNIDRYAVWSVCQGCVEIYLNGEFRHFIDGEWRDGKMPECATMIAQIATTGKMLGRYITLKGETWYKRDEVIL